MDEGELWRRWCASRDAAARAELIERHTPFARSVAARLYMRRVHDAVEFEEYFQYALVGLLEAVERYRPDRGALFRTFAAARIRGAVINGLERATERQQQAAAQRRLTAERMASLAPEPVSREPSERLLAQLGELAIGLALGFLLEGEVESVPDRSVVDAYTQLEFQQVRRQVWSMVERLPEREREIIRTHYTSGRQFEEIARAMKLTKGRISQLHRQAIVRLRALVSKAERCDVAY